MKRSIDIYETNPIIIAIKSNSEGQKDYSITFYFADVLLAMALLCFFYLEVEVEKSEGSFMRDVLKLIRLVHIDIFMLMMWLLGTCWGFLEAFLFVFLIELNASSTMLGELLFILKPASFYSRLKTFEAVNHVI